MAHGRAACQVCRPRRPAPRAPRGGCMSRDRVRHLARAYWVDIALAVFILLNLLAMRVLPEWQTVPFLIIWVSLTLIYGFRLWRLGSTIVTVATLTLATGGVG